MEKRGKKLIFKKILAIFCIFALLQGYISAFSQVVMAFEEEITIGPGGSIFDETTGGNEDNNQNVVFSDENQNETDENVTGQEDENTVENEVSNEVSNTVSNEIANETVDNEILNETTENETVENQTEVPSENQEEEKPEEEPYVEPSVTLEVSSENSTIYKGYLYANATSDLKYATDYNTIDKLEIVGGKNMTSLTVQDEPDKFQLITNTKVGLMNQMYYRQTRVSVDEFKNILGEDGVITLYTSDGNVIGEINKDTEVENGEYVYIYSTQFDSVKFELTNIINDGSISFKNDKSIKETSDFSRNQISLFSSINTVANLNMQVGDVNTPQSAEGNINLEETESCMAIDLDTDTLSVEEPNDLTISVTLKSNSERYDLFENPTVDIEFPSAAKTVEITGINLLYKNGLTIDSYTVVKNAYGNNVLKVALTGAQLEYTPGAVQEGTTIVINTRVDVDRLTADTQESLKMTYTNKDTVRKSYTLAGKDSEDVTISFVGRKELVRALELTDSNNTSVTSYDEATEKIQLNTNENQVIGVTGAIVNNYETTLNDVVIVGRIPFVGNKDVNGNDLETNFDSKLQGAISTTGVVSDIYYSEDGEADINSDSWSLDVTDFSNIKSYKIVVREKTLAKGEKLFFTYNLVIPESVGYNSKGFTSYFVNYKIDTQNYFNQCSCGLFTEEKEISMDDLNDDDKQEVAELTIGTQVSQGGIILGETDSVYERQVLKYTLVVRNTSNITANNVVIRANAENANLYSWEYNDLPESYYTNVRRVKQMKEYTSDEKEFEEFTIESLKPDESQTFEFEVIVKNLSEIETPEVYGKIYVSSSDSEEQEVNTIKNQILDSDIEVRLENNGTENDDIELENETLTTKALWAKIKNISDRDLNNVTYVVNLPDNVTLLESAMNSVPSKAEYTTEKLVDGGTKLTFTIPEIKAGDTENIYIYVKINSMDYTIHSKTLTVKSYVDYNDNIIKSNDYVRKYYQSETKMEYKLTSDVNSEYVENNQQIVFTLNAKNLGYTNSKLIKAVADIPSGLEIVDISFQNSGDDNFETANDKKLSTLFSVNQESEQNLRITTKVNENLFNTDQKTIEFGMNITDANNNSENTNVISYKINNPNTSSNMYNIPQYQEIIDRRDNQNNSNQSQNNNNNSNNNNNNNNQNRQNSNSNNNSNSNQNQNTNQTEQPTKTLTKTFYISGLAWIDKNQDGIRQSDEEMKSGVVVSLYRANSNGGLDTSSLVQTTSTTEDGKYVFSGVGQGQYIIVFDYNSSRYKVTRYQVETATSTEDSDAISKKVTIDGTTDTLGVTEVLTIDNSSLISVDIGLVDKTNFDLKLDKTISSVVVKNDSGTKKYNFKNSTDAKLEIRSKYYKSSVLDITYTIKITNEGDVSGYATKIVDYLPDDIEVVLNSSPGWYIGSDNGLYYTGLNEEEIEPGESKECTLVIRKSLANGEAAKLVNSAEIAESTNPYGLVDRDSIENNKEPSEDDYGTSTLTISISTGNTANYIITTLIIIIMIAVIVRIVIKLKTTKKIYR